jgi:hypothetical protein
MPEPVRAIVEAFVAEHHVERRSSLKARSRRSGCACASRAAAEGSEPMSEPDNFLQRWSRRKRQALKQPEQPSDDRQAPETDARDQSAPVAQSEKAPAQALVHESTEPVFDLTKLPSIESITAETDIRAFLAPGVPTELKLAALRRAWASDPKVRDFVGLADYDWDFHTPGALPGFGPLEMTDDLRREVNRIVGAWQAQEERVAPTLISAKQPDEDGDAGSVPSAVGGETDSAPQPDTAANEDGARDNLEYQNELMGTEDPPQRNTKPAATQQEQSDSNDSPLSARSGHGGALPRLPE